MDFLPIDLGRCEHLNMKCSISFLFILALAATSNVQFECDPKKSTSALPGKSIPLRPQDVPKGCNAFEILIGKSKVPE